MEKMNLFNFFGKRSLTDQALAVMAVSLLPALFVVKGIEGAFVYSILLTLYLVLSVLIQTFVYKFMPEKMREVLVLVGLVVSVTAVKLIADVVFYNFASLNSTYLYLMILNPVPVVFFKQEEELPLSNKLYEMLVKAVNILVLLLVFGLLREILGSATLTFGAYLEFIPSKVIDLGFTKYAIGVLLNPLGAFLIFGLLLALIKRLSKDSEVTQWFT